MLSLSLSLFFCKCKFVSTVLATRLHNYFIDQCHYLTWTGSIAGRKLTHHPLARHPEHVFCNCLQLRIEHSMHQNLRWILASAFYRLRITTAAEAKATSGLRRGSSSQDSNSHERKSLGNREHVPQITEKFEKSKLKLRILSFVPQNLTSDLHHGQQQQ